MAQDFLSLITSFRIGNRNLSDIEFALGDDIRKFENQKVDSWGFRRDTVLASASPQNVQPLPGAVGNTLGLVFFSHPVVIVQYQGAALAVADQLFTSFMGYYRPAGASQVNTTWFQADNTLDSTTTPPYNAVTATLGNHRDAEMTQIWADIVA